MSERRPYFAKLADHPGVPTAAWVRIERLRRERDGYVKLLREAQDLCARVSDYTVGDPSSVAGDLCAGADDLEHRIKAALDSGSGGAATRKDAGATPSGEAADPAPGAADLDGSD